LEKLLDDQTAGQVSAMFSDLAGQVEILYFGTQEDCLYCEDILKLLHEVSALSGLINLKIYDLEKDAETARQYHVDKAPTLVIAAREGDSIIDYGVRFVGAPAGHEFTTLIHDLIAVSKRESHLTQETKDILAGLTDPLLLQVFVTPTCPYCPQAVSLAHNMAIESPMVQAEMVEATEFPSLAAEFHVGGVPQTTINRGAGTLVGAAPEEKLVAEIKRVLAAQK